MSKPDLFAVFGPSKSGTTWLQKMLDAHPAVSCQFQPGLFALRDVERAPGLAISRGNSTPYGGVFDSPEAEEQYLARRSFINSAAFLTPDYPESIAPGAPANVLAELNRVHRLMSRGAIETYLRQSTDKPVVGFKAYTDVDYLMELFPNARIVFMVRDGRDVCVSMRHHRLRQGIYYNGDEKWAALRLLNRSTTGRRFTKALFGAFPQLKGKALRDLTEGPLFCEASLTKAALDWRNVAAYILEKRAQYPEHNMIVRYEELLLRPEATISSVFQFLDVAADDSTLASIVEGHTIGRMQERQTKSGGSFFRKGVSGDWLDVFNEGDVQLFKHLAGDVLIELGYETDRDWSLASTSSSRISG